MIHNAKKLVRVLCGMVVMLVLAASITAVPVLAASNGIYIATATPHYKHPTTGAIEDAGGDGSAALGQSMTESATYKQALVEVDPQGNTYITVRLQLMDNIQNPQFQVDGKSVTATLMQENYGSLSKDNTADYRMKVNSENSVIRCNMYVIAMGREVVFYITVSNLQAGSGDFISSVKVVEPETTTPPANTETPETTTSPATTKKPDTSTTVPDASNPADTTTSSESESKTDETTDSSETEDDKTIPSGLQEYDEDGNLVEDNEDNEATETAGDNKVDFTIGLVIGGVLVVGAVGFCVWYFCFFKKKK